MSDKIIETRISREDIDSPNNYDREGAQNANKKIADERGGKEFLSSGSDVSIAVLSEEADKAKLEAESRLDPLTGIFNRWALEEEMVRLMSHAERTREPLSLIYFDLDHFKAIDEYLTHVAADPILTDFAAFIGNQIRPEDFWSRYGGDEFVLILPNTAEEKASSFISRVRSNFASFVATQPQLQVLPARITQLDFSSGTCLLSDVPHGRNMDSKSVLESMITRAEKKTMTEKGPKRENRNK